MATITPKQFRIPDELIARVDAAKGHLSRTAFVILALERTLSDETPRPSPAGREAKSEAAIGPARPAAASRPGASRPTAPAPTLKTVAEYEAMFEARKRTP